LGFCFCFFDITEFGTDYFLRLRFSEISPEEKEKPLLHQPFFLGVEFLIVLKCWTIFCHKFNDLEKKKTKNIEI
jgi:hypothetical protein